MQNIIVSGATGYIGSEFVKLLVTKGINVIALGRKKYGDISNYRKQSLKGASYLTIDMANIDRLPLELKSRNISIGNECVFFNLAWGGTEKLSDLDIEAQLMNVIWNEKALEIAHEIGCSKFIQVGTMEEAFTHKYLELDYNHNSEYNRHVIYSVAKIAANKTLDIKSSLLGIDYNYVLHSHVMGPDDDKDSFLQVTLQKLIDGDDLIFSTGEQIFDVISKEDCVEGYYLICKKGKNKSEYWVGSGKPRRLREYVEMMYHLFPSNKTMQFGKFPYDDVKLSKEDFSIKNLVNDTGFTPKKSYTDIVKELRTHLLEIK
jgi:nucleoside-diphosphate-sugar epimerase